MKIIFSAYIASTIDITIKTNAWQRPNKQMASQRLGTGRGRGACDRSDRRRPRLAVSSQHASVLRPCLPVGPWSHPDVTGAAEGLLICALLPCSVFPIQPLCGGAPKVCFADDVPGKAAELEGYTLRGAPTQRHPAPSPNLAKDKLEGQTRHHR